MFQGVATALITPFKNNQIDLAAFQQLLRHQLKNGVNALLVCGSTGESNFLTLSEREKLVNAALQKTKGTCPVIVGTTAFSTNKTITLTKNAQSLGADAALIVPPPYVKPSQEGIYQYFKDVHDAVDIPIILYDNPARSIVKIEIETIERLAKLPRIIGLKDATGDLARPALIRPVVPKGFKLYSGEDSTALAFLAEGGDGCISVTSNIAPKLCADLQKSWFSGKYDDAFQIRDVLAPLNKVMFCESNPVPVKYAVSLLGIGDPAPRKPLLTATPSSQEKILSAMQKSGLIPLPKASQAG